MGDGGVVGIAKAGGRGEEERIGDADVKLEMVIRYSVQTA